MKKYVMLAAMALSFGLFSSAQADYYDNNYGNSYGPWDGGGDCCCERNSFFDGFYLGGTVGWGAHDYIWNDRDAWGDRFTNDFNHQHIHQRFDGFTGGVQAGYNYLCGCALVGLELDANWADFRRTSTFSSAVVGTTLTLHDRANWFGTIRGRLGIVCDDLLLYVTMGAVVDYHRHHWTITSTGVIEDFFRNRARWGGTLGTGAEYALSECLSFKVEGLYFLFPEHHHSVFDPVNALPARFDFLDDAWVFRVGVNFKLF